MYKRQGDDRAALPKQIERHTVDPGVDRVKPFEIRRGGDAVSYTHLRAHETVLDLVCRLLLVKKQKNPQDLDDHTTNRQPLDL